MTPKQFFAFAKKHGAEMVDLKFTDLLGTWQHCSFPTETWSESTFKEGVGFDGSSIRGWQGIEASDMLVVPDASTAILDPFTERPTLSLVCDIVDPITRERYSRDPRWIATKTLNYLKMSGIGDQIFFGPEAEFFVFDSAAFETTANSGFFHVDSIEGRWNSGRDEDGKKLGADHRSATRYIKKVAAAPPQTHGGVCFVPLRFHGQSFLLHQIRKMTAVVCAVVAWHSLAFVQMSKEFEDVLLGNTPAWILQSVLPIGFGLIAWRYSLYTVHELFGLFRGEAAA